MIFNHVEAHVSIVRGGLSHLTPKRPAPAFHQSLGLSGPPPQRLSARGSSQVSSIGHPGSHEGPWLSPSACVLKALLSQAHSASLPLRPHGPTEPSSWGSGSPRLPLPAHLRAGAPARVAGAGLPAAACGVGLWCLLRI